MRHFNFNNSTKNAISRLSFAFSIIACILFTGTAWGQAKVTVESGISAANSMLLEVKGVDDASVSATPVERTSPNGKQLYCAYDIDITKDGREWQPEPEQPAMVSMTDPGFADGQMLDIYHEGANGLEFVATVASENGKITFPAHSFSVYIVTQAEDFYRLKVNLHQADGNLVTIFVKKLDIDRGDFNLVVYNPGMGTIDPASGVSCMGWIAKENYTKDDVPDALTYDMVRDSIRNRLNAGLAEDGIVLDFYTMLFKYRSVTYLDHNEAVVQTDQLLFRVDEDMTVASYTVNAPYTTDDSHKFEGWKINPDHNTSGINIDGWDADANNYTNLTTISITGDVVFDVHLIEGNWLVFNENGKGGTYNAPIFVLRGELTVCPALATRAEMKRKGYDFDRWYTDSLCTPGNEFDFGGEIDERTTIYAKWNPHTTAPYTVILWTENLNRNGFEVAGSYVNENGRVDQNIPFTFVDNGDEDYVTGVGTGNGHYTGFCLADSCRGKQVVITTEGDAVLNLYYYRITYNFKFYLYRERNDSPKYSYPYNSGSGDNLGNLVTWGNNSTSWENSHPTTNYVSGDLPYETYGGNKYYYFVMQAYYGEDITAKWPKYENFTGVGSRQPVSFVMMVGTKLKPRATSSGSGTVKGIITVMNENILGATNNANGNYVMVRFPGSYNNWRYHIWFETIEDETYTNIREYNGKTYYEESVMEVRSSNTNVSDQNEPKYTGFDFLEKRGQNWNNSNYWTTTENNKTVYNLNFVYTRQKYKISYFDGNYVDGNGNMIQNNASNLITESAVIGQGATIADEKKNYVPDCPESGYIFEGWYVDEGCVEPYRWDKMTVGGIAVFAKWRQIQYRVFLHPNVPASDETLDWGTRNQSMNFRRSYGDKISVPKGLREEYEQIGWYTDEACTQVFNSDLVLNESSVTFHYDKTRDFTDPMDMWGNGATWNSDSMSNETTVREPVRFWVTKKFDLYAKWRAKLRGANGITIKYVDYEGNNDVPTDDFYYQDNVDAIAGHATTTRDPQKEFAYWVLQTYNHATGRYDDSDITVYPGATFVVHKSDAKTEVLKWYNPTDPERIYEGDFDTTLPKDPNPDDEYSECLATYTVMLRAEYIDKNVEHPTYTFIEWFRNDGTDTIERTDGNIDLRLSTLGLNEAVVPPVPERYGYNFKGWYKSENGTGAPVADCQPNFLYYNGSYYKESTYTNSATHVAADSHDPIEYLYAIWEPKVEFDLPSVCQGAPIELPLTTNYNIDLSADGWNWDATSGTVAGQSFTPSEGTSVTLTFTPASSTCAPATEFTMPLKTPNVPNASSYDFIWRGGTASHLTDWNTESNWFVYNSNYSIATAVPTSESRIYIGPADCVTSNWPSQTAEASAKDITIASGASLEVPTGKTLKIYGNLDNIGTLSATDGTVEFCGTSERAANQTISHDITLGNVVFYNQGGDIVPSGNVTINGAATFKDGVVKHDVTFGAAASVAGEDAMTYNSYVDGKVTKNGHASGFTFPTGQNSVLGKIKATSDAENVSVQYFHNPRGFTESEMPRWWNINDMCSNNNPQLDHVSNFEYWKVETPVALESILTVSAADGSAHFNSNTLTHEADDIYGAFWNGSCWENIGGGSQHVSVEPSPYGTISVDVKIPHTRTVYDKIVTLGSKDHNTILPIELTSFSATCDGRSSHIMWTTATEKNNDYFSLERSDDAINFVEIARIAGAGNSIEPLSYSYTDYGVYGGDNYYRLVQVDYDGTRTASEIIVTNCVETSEEEPEVIAYPNPFNSDLTVELENFGDRPASIEVYDLLGRLVYVERADAPQNNYQTILHLGDLSKSTYTVRVSTADFVINRKVVKD